MRRSRGLGVGLAHASLLSFLPACSDDSSSSDGRAAVRVCNDLPNDGGEVHYTAQSGVPPTPMGGFILDGTYELAAMNLYNSGTAPARFVRMVYQITGTTIQEVSEVEGDERTHTSTFTPQGTLLVIEHSCPEYAYEQLGYTATSTELRLSDVPPGSAFELVFVRR